MGQLTLKRAAASRLSGEWSDDDFDVLADGVAVGRIMKAAAAPVGTPWLWTLAYGYHEDRTPTHGYERRARLRWRRSPRAGGWFRCPYWNGLVSPAFALYVSAGGQVPTKRADAKDRAAQAKDLSIKSAFEHLAAGWVALAEQAERIDREKFPLRDEKDNR
jgi:hypothetical protein